MSPRWPVFLLTCVVSLSVVRAAVQPSHDPTLLRATHYVDEFVGRFANVVAEERYVQQTWTPSRRRELRSEFLMVRPPGSSGWFQFRDVFEVDGVAVQGREDVLSELFLTPADSAVERAAQVTKESARYNLLDIGTLNSPLTAISFLQARYFDRFQFVRGPLDGKVAGNARVFAFEETDIPTILRNGRTNGNLPTNGRVWIDENTGAVLQTELIFHDNFLENQVVTSFRFESQIGVNVPVAMRERYELARGVLVGTATYSRFRRYQVQTDETVR